VDFTCAQLFDPADTTAYANVCGPSLTTDTPPVWGGSVIVPDSTNGNPYWTKVESFVQSGASACGSCHDSAAAGVHFQTMTINSVESCATCHAAGKAFESSAVHVASP